MSSGSKKTDDVEEQVSKREVATTSPNLAPHLLYLELERFGGW